ncbi:MAG: hypothetical protein EXS48_01755 [Candidatus Staskawiczbacteria bacterium]|nr:hypothetical protein [Candidatus Staskawiczbacteria bacterium]
MIEKTNNTFVLSTKCLNISICIVIAFLATSYFLESPRVAILGGIAGISPQIIALSILILFWLKDSYKQYAKNINDTCPKCSSQEPPLFICPNCDENVESLRPSIYGIFTCYCGHCQHLLPTTDNGGRLELKKVCRQCSADMAHDYIGKQSEYRFGIVGARSSGKTTFMISAVSSLEREFGKDNDMEIKFGNGEQEKGFRNSNQALDQGLVLPQTLRSVPKALTVALNPAHGNGCLLYIYDAAGEEFTENEYTLEKHPIHLYNGILLVVDPFAEQGVRDGLFGKIDKEEIESNNPAPVEAKEVLSKLINVLERVLKVRVGGKIPLPLAIVVTKIDAFGSLNKIKRNAFGGWYYSMTAAANDAEYHSFRIQNFLQKGELGNFTKLVESRFARVSYFGVSALGRSGYSSEGSAFKSYGVSAPLIWLAFRSGALTDEDSWERSFANAQINLFRSLRGVEGGKSAKKAWLIMLYMASFLIGICILPIILMPPLLIALTIGIPAIGLFFLYGWLFAVLVLRRFH